MTTLSGVPLLVTILVIAAGTMLTRFLPFMIFPDGRPVPRFVQRLQYLLPSAAIGLLLVYCLRELDLFHGDHGLPQLIAIGVIVVLHLWRHNTLLSIAAGTISYMLLVQLVF